jgi:peptidoglycan/LPS O-acetylase OafA/YrhL
MSSFADKQIRFHFIDGMRAIACMMVMLHHAVSANIARFFISHGFPKFGEFLWNIPGSGVDLFFVISGLVLLRPYLRNERKFDTLIYLKKRFIRIYPTYFVALLFGAAVIWYINTFPTWYNEKGIYVIFAWKTTLMQALLFNIDGVYYNLAWWSVQVEALFYLLVPILIVFFPKNEKLKDSKILIIIVSCLIGSFGLQLFLDSYLPVLYSYHNIVLNMGRIIDYPMCFLMGMLLAAHDFSKKQAYSMILVGIVLVMMQWVYKPAIHTGYGFLYAGLVVLSFNFITFQKFLSVPLLLWIGERSYSLFLVHFSVFYLINNLTAKITTHRGFEYALITRGVGIPVSFFVAMLLFHFVERKFARGLVTDHIFWPWEINKLKK